MHEEAKQEEADKQRQLAIQLSKDFWVQGGPFSMAPSNKLMSMRPGGGGGGGAEKWVISISVQYRTVDCIVDCIYSMVL